MRSRHLGDVSKSRLSEVLVFLRVSACSTILSELSVTCNDYVFADSDND